MWFNIENTGSVAESVGALDLKSGDPEFKSHSDH